MGMNTMYTYRDEFKDGGEITCDWHGLEDVVKSEFSGHFPDVDNAAMSLLDCVARGDWGMVRSLGEFLGVSVRRVV